MAPSIIQVIAHAAINLMMRRMFKACGGLSIYCATAIGDVHFMPDCIFGVEVGFEVRVLWTTGGTYPNQAGFARNSDDSGGP